MLAYIPAPWILWDGDSAIQLRMWFDLVASNGSWRPFHPFPWFNDSPAVFFECFHGFKASSKFLHAFLLNSYMHDSCFVCCESIHTFSGWWFGTCFFSSYIGNNNPNWLSYFSEGWLNHQPVVDGEMVTGCSQWRPFSRQSHHARSSASRGQPRGVSRDEPGDTPMAKNIWTPVNYQNSPNFYAMNMIKKILFVFFVFPCLSCLKPPCWKRDRLNFVRRIPS